MRRLLLYVVIMQFRGWVLYSFVDTAEDFIVNAIDSAKEDSNCWYSHLLYNGSSCNTGRDFDFSDHVVFFFAHSLPIMLFEALFWVMFPSWPCSNDQREDAVMKKGRDRSPIQRCDRMLAIFFNTILPVPLILAFCYGNIIVMISIKSTAAYYHTFGETVVGYVISLIVQLPLGFILCSEKWVSVRSFLGFPAPKETSM